MASFASDVASSKGGAGSAKTSIGVRELNIPARSANEEELVRTLAKSGRVAWSGGKPRGLGKAARVRGPSVSDAVVEDRR